MNDAVLNCVIGVCCDASSANQIEAMASYYEANGLDKKSAKRAAKICLEYFDLAPKGTLQPFKDAIAKLARGADYKQGK